MTKPWMIDRRTMLRGTGVALSLPMLDAMVTPQARAASSEKPPVRMGFIFAPNGKHMQDWTPGETGEQFKLPHLLEPFQHVKHNLTVFTGLTHDKARANGDGGGDHARNAGTYLTGMQCRKTAGKDISTGVSVDQIAANKFAGKTPLASLELGTEAGRQAGNCDSGYSCAYSSNISWRSPSTPMAKEINPRLVFERLFGDANALANKKEAAKQASYRKSLLDLVREDAQSLSGRISGADKHKLDEYLDTVRSIEQRIQASEGQSANRVPDGIETPAGIPREYADHLKLMYELMALAFQTDTTRVATFMVANAGSNRTYPDLGVSEGHHSLSHHQNDAQKQEHIKKINRFHTEVAASFLERLEKTKEGDKSLLDSCMILYGSGIADGNRHNHDNLPIVVAGNAGGRLKAGRHLKYDKNTPLCNLFLSMLDRVDVSIDRFGDSTGRLPGLS